SSSQKVERFLGWQFNPRRLEEPVKFATADAYRDTFHEPRLLEPLLAHGDIHEALRELKPPVPQPELELEANATDLEPAADGRGAQITRGRKVTLRVKIAGPLLAQDQVESLTGQMDDELPQKFDLSTASGQCLSRVIDLPADRRAHTIQIRLR